MCGRYVSPDEAAIEREWHIGRQNSNPFPRRFNVAPTTQVPILRISRESGELELTLARWGLVPHWWKEAKLPTFSINARAEEVATKPMWRDSMRTARCLVPAEGWYEWQESERVDSSTGEVKRIKQPHFIHRRDGRPVGFAGLMSACTLPGQDTTVMSCAILTKAASESVAGVHDRMPVVLPPEAQAAWLDREMKDAGKACEIVRACAVSDFEHYAVSTRVNNAKNEDETLVDSVTPNMKH
jgi:putative SOS response-associated peptidase YedK